MSASKKKNVPNVTTVGLDCALSSTGVAILQGSKLVKAGRILTTKKRDGNHTQRNRIIMRKCFKVFDMMKPDLVAIEDYAFSQNSQADAALKELGGAMRMRLFEEQIPFVLVGIGQLKKYATGNGSPGVKKSQVAAAVEKFWGFTHSSSDPVDAFVLAQVARALACRGAMDWALTSYQKAVIKKLMKSNNPHGNLDLITWELRE